MAVSAVNVCIFCFGNSARGDDGLGEALYDALLTEQLRSPQLFAHVHLSLGFQLQPEQVFDMEGADMVIFVDAQTGTREPVTWTPIQPGTQLQFTTHHLPAESLLFLFQKTFNKSAPRSFQLGIAAHQFELGSGLSTPARQNLRLAQQLLLDQLKACAAS